MHITGRKPCDMVREDTEARGIAQSHHASSVRVTVSNKSPKRRMRNGVPAARPLSHEVTRCRT
jgi:hypothetical protein